MAQFEVFTSYKWPTDYWPVATLSVQVDEIAHRLGAEIHTWIEDGLGTARGFGGSLPSGVVILFEEIEGVGLKIQSNGPAIYADALEVGTRGAGAILAEILEVLEIARSSVSWILSLEGEASAKKHAEEAMFSLSKKLNQKPI